MLNVAHSDFPRLDRLQHGTDGRVVDLLVLAVVARYRLERFQQPVEHFPLVRVGLESTRLRERLDRLGVPLLLPLEQPISERRLVQSDGSRRVRDLDLAPLDAGEQVGVILLIAAPRTAPATVALPQRRIISEDQLLTTNLNHERLPGA